MNEIKSKKINYENPISNSSEVNFEMLNSNKQINKQASCLNNHSSESFLSRYKSI